jgi:hypothetical protein
MTRDLPSATREVARRSNRLKSVFPVCVCPFKPITADTLGTPLPGSSAGNATMQNLKARQTIRFAGKAGSTEALIALWPLFEREFNAVNASLALAGVGAGAPDDK